MTVYTTSDQLDLFDDPQRWPRRPYCADDLSAGLRIRSLRQALAHPYIQANPPNLRVWSIYDVDRPGAALAWEAAGLPPPTWAAINRRNAHGHLVWGLSAPVLVAGDGARDAPMRYLCAIESLMRERLRADPGYAGLITKNPCHPLWRVLRGPRLGYDLSELSEWLPDLDKHRPLRRRPEEVGLGRNVTLFDALRHYAYRAIRDWKPKRNYVLWQAHLYERALVRNGDFGTPLDPREVYHIARSVAKWVWHRFDLAGSDRRFGELQAARARLRAKAHRAATADLRAAAAAMRAQGMSLRQIGAEMGVSYEAVRRWLSDPISDPACPAPPASGGLSTLP